MSFKLTIGRTAVLGIDAFHNEAIVSIYPHEGVERDFLKFYLPSIDYAALQDRAIKGNTLNRGKIEQLPVLLPPQTEQRVIASLLNTIQERMVLEERHLATIKELKAATMAKVFREGLHGEALKKTEVGEIPQSWEIARIGDPAFAETQAGGTPSRALPSYFQGEIPWVKSGELEDRQVLTTEEHLTREAIAASAAKLLPKGTLLVAMYGATAGKTGILGVEAATNQAICAIRQVGDSFDPVFLQHWLIHRRVAILSLRHGGAQPNISQTILRAVQVPVPSETEQKEIGAIFGTMSARLEVGRQRHGLLSSLFHSTLYQLMTGQLRVTPLLEQDPAHAS